MFTRAKMKRIGHRTRNGFTATCSTCGCSLRFPRPAYFVIGENVDGWYCPKCAGKFDFTDIRPEYAWALACELRSAYREIEQLRSFIMALAGGKENNDRL